jgi:hypothetical protein
LKATGSTVSQSGVVRNKTDRKMARRSYCLVGGIVLPVRNTTCITVMMLAIFIVLVGGAAAQDSPPVTADDPVVTLPAMPADDPTEPVVTVPVAPVETVPAPVILPDPTVRLQALLIKRVKLKIMIYGKNSSKWQRLLHLRLAPISGLSPHADLAAANAVLGKVRARSRALHRRWMLQSIEQSRHDMEHMLLVMGKRPIVRTLSSSMSIEKRLLLMRKQKAETYSEYRNPAHLAQFTCIHHFEGSWTDSGAPFWGGLQMDMGFQATYGGWLLRTKGTADHWTPLEQIWVAERAVPSRGFNPWPNTARYCGLL